MNLPSQVVNRSNPFFRGSAEPVSQIILDRRGIFKVSFGYDLLYHIQNTLQVSWEHE